MKNKEARRERYLRDPLPIRLGGIAANLARIKSSAGNPLNYQVVNVMLYESKFYIEWTAAETPIETAAALVELQLALVGWGRRWATGYSDPETRNALIEFARAWSDRVLEMSGLLDTAT